MHFLWHIGGTVLPKERYGLTLPQSGPCVRKNFFACSKLIFTSSYVEVFVTTDVPNVLIIEQNRLVGDLLLKALTSAGFVADSVSSVEDAVAWSIGGTNRRVVILNRDVPNARTFAESIRTNLSIKVIALAPSGELDSSERVLVYTVLDNSAGLRRLIATIRAFLRIDPPPNRKNQPILIADKEKAIRELVYEFFAARGYNVLLASTADEAFEVLRRETEIAVVLLDVTLPSKGGVEILKQLVRISPQSAIIMMSGQADAELAKRTLRLGAFDYIFKPLDLPVLEGLISAAVART